MAKATAPWMPSEADYQNVLSEQNPWHRDGAVPDAWALEVRRPLAKSLWQRLLVNDPRRFQVVLGPRRVGKTTSLYQTVREFLNRNVPRRRLWWLRLDHPLLVRFDLGHLARYVIQASQATPDSPAYLFFDELTYARDWDLWLKTFYDEAWPIQVSGSSSATAILRERRMESGIGRWDEQYLAPYTFTEYLELVHRAVSVPVHETTAETIEACIAADLDTHGLADWRRRFTLTGGFPELLIRGRDGNEDEQSALLLSQRTLRTDAVERALYKDIPQAFGVDNPMLLERLLYVLAGQIAGVLSPRSICQSLDGLSQPTFDKYLAYLEKAFLVFAIPNYGGAEESKQRRGRKLYFVDGAVRNAALQRGIAPLTNAGEMGLLLENLAAAHLHCLSQQTSVRLYHWRDKQWEIDLIYDHPAQPLAFEIASSEQHSRQGPMRFLERFPRFRGRCYLVAPNCASKSATTSEDGIGILNAELFLLAVGAQTDRELTFRLGAEISAPGKRR
jgi:predicted AAA+ superfamily ATPase